MNLQRDVSVLIGPSAFVRRAKTDDALYVSDIPRRLPSDTLRLLEAQLNQHGFVCVTTKANLWKINPTDDRLHAALLAYPQVGGVPFPQDDPQIPVYALYRLLQKHPAKWMEQPRGLLLTLLKRIDRPPNELLSVIQPLLESCSERLRKGLPLPSEAAPMLAYWLNHGEGEI